MDSKEVPLWLFDHIHNAIDEMRTLSRTGERVTPEMLGDWRGLLCAVMYVSGRPLTQEEKEFARALQSEEPKA